MTDFYGQDLASVHAEAYEALAVSAAAMLLTLLGDGDPGRRVLDLGCGAGPLSRRMVGHEFSTWGIDVSPALISLARERMPQAQFECGSILDAEFPKATAAAAVGEVLNYATTADSSALSEVFRRVFEALDPGGVFLLDIAAPGRAGTGRAFSEGPGWAVGVIATEADNQLIRQISIFRRHQDSLWSRTHEEHRLRLWPSSAVTEQLASCGFLVEQLSGYGGVAMPPALNVYLARKPD